MYYVMYYVMYDVMYYVMYYVMYGGAGAAAEWRAQGPRELYRMSCIM
jgi:hypothetical protein